MNWFGRWSLKIIKSLLQSHTHSTGQSTFLLRLYVMSIITEWLLSSPRRGKARRNIYTQTVQWVTRLLSQKAVIRLETMLIAIALVQPKFWSAKHQEWSSSTLLYETTLFVTVLQCNCDNSRIYTTHKYRLQTLTLKTIKYSSYFLQ